MSTLKPNETAQKILDAAILLWSEKGYEKSTLRELAKRVGMGVSSLYFYFKSKEEIVHYLYRTLNESTIAQFKATPLSTDLAENLSRFFKIKFALLKNYRSCCVTILKEAIDPESHLNPLHAHSIQVLDQSVSLFQEMIEQSGLAEAEKAAVLARFLWIAHIGLILYWLHDTSENSKNTEKLIEKIKEMIPLLPFLGQFPMAAELLGLMAAVFERPTLQSSFQSVLSRLETEESLKSYDIVVVGGGPVGALYASWIKLKRPQTQILILDRSAETGHKIGESTLSGICKAARSVGIRQAALQRLFFPKNGLGFFHVHEAVKNITQAPEYILEAFDETFQVERRVWDALLLENARRLGVEVLQGAELQLDQSRLARPHHILNYKIGSRTFKINTPLLVDASGPAGVLTKHLHLQGKAGITFQSGSVWAYFKNVKPLAGYAGWKKSAQFPRDQYTQHLCFKEGWLWYIPLVSWQESPTRNLQQLLERLLKTGRGMPTREELSEEYGCPTQFITSVGISLRSDRDSALSEDPRAAFEHYTQKYPAIAQLLEGAELLPDYYGNGQTYMTRLNVRQAARQAAGDGWLLIGDAAFFVDPLISPGLTGGAAQAYYAVEETLKAFESQNFSRETFADYESFNKKLHHALERDNQLVYRSFNHPEAIELIQRFQEIDARRHFHQYQKEDYTLADTNVWGILNPAYQALQIKVDQILREEEEAVGMELSIDEQSPKDYERLVQRLKACLNPYLESHQDLTPFVGRNSGSAIF